MSNGYKMRFAQEEEAKAFYVKKNRSQYRDIYEKILEIEKGSCLVVEFDDAKKAKRACGAIRTRFSKDKRTDGTYSEFYVTGCHEVLIVGKGV